MKKLGLIMALVLLSITGVFAQKKGKGQDKRVEKQAQQLKTDLDLNDDQYNKVLALLSKQPPMERMGEGMNREEMKAKRDEMKAKREAMNAEYKAILTANQYAKFQEIQKKRNEENRPRPEPRN